jgi:hypothetical protein
LSYTRARFLLPALKKTAAARSIAGEIYPARDAPASP